MEIEARIGTDIGRAVIAEGDVEMVMMVDIWQITVDYGEVPRVGFYVTAN